VDPELDPNSILAHDVMGEDVDATFEVGQPRADRGRLGVDHDRQRDGRGIERTRVAGDASADLELVPALQEPFGAPQLELRSDDEGRPRPAVDPELMLELAAGRTMT